MEEIYHEIQRLIIYMIPEKWKNIKLYASINMNTENNQDDKNAGELFFYYLPNKLFKKEYINCYEVPALFDIDQNEYFELITKLYNKILILQTLDKMQFSNITLTIEENKFKIEKYYNDITNSLFSSYERHIIWRYKYLNIKPVAKKEIEILEKYMESEENIEIPKIEELNIEIENTKNIVDYERILTVEEAIERSIITEENDDIKKSKIKEVIENENNNKYNNRYNNSYVNELEIIQELNNNNTKNDSMQSENTNELFNTDNQIDNDEDDEDIGEILKQLKNNSKE
ncbi:MAG: immunity protein YezG family protein [Clostridium sp.]